jgi:hypothetical protein
MNEESTNDNTRMTRIIKCPKCGHKVSKEIVSPKITFKCENLACLGFVIVLKNHSRTDGISMMYSERPI